jgi:thiamine biosynthesis protein ThiS
VRIRLNGGEHEASQGDTLRSLLETMSLPTGRVAVELNGRVVARAEFEHIEIREGDVLEVVHFVGGG